MTYQPRDFGTHLTPAEEKLRAEIQQAGQTAAIEQTVETPVPVAAPASSQEGVSEPVNSLPQAVVPLSLQTVESAPNPKSAPQPETSAGGDLQTRAQTLYTDALAGNLAAIEANISPTAAVK